MAKFTEVPQYFLERAALQFLGNLAHHFHAPVEDRDFFDPLKCVYSPPDCETVLRVAFSKRELEEMVDEDDLRLHIPRTFSALWHESQARQRMQAVVEEMAAVGCETLRQRDRGGTDAFESRFTRFCDAVQLSALEREIFLVSYLIHLRLFSFPVSVSAQRAPYYYAMTVDRSYDEVRAVMVPEGRLQKFHLMDDDWDFNPRCEGFFTGAENEGGIFDRHFYRQAELTGALPLDYFGSEFRRDGELILQLLASGKKLNVLFYGAPGTGKTSLAQTLAKLSGRRTFEVPQGGMTKDARNMRLVGIESCNAREAAESSLLLIDESDELLRNAGAVGSAVRSTEKGVTNTLLDELEMPAFWIANTEVDAIDASVRRRFDYSVFFESLNGEQRVRIWQKSVEKFELGGLISEEQMHRYAANYLTNAGGIAFVLQNVKRLGPTAETVDGLIADLMRPHCQLMEIRTPEMIQPVADYSLEGLNVTSRLPLPQIVRAVKNFGSSAYTQRDADAPRMTILLSGVPGSGKSEFVKYLAKQVNRPVLVKRASDLLSCYVGETEKRLRSAFRQAEREGAILFLDEADSFIRDREGAHHSWEVTQVNELLQQMESFSGILVAATNFRSALDAASTRRFTFKVDFDYLNAAGRRLFFERMFKTKLSKTEARELDQLETLTPGDFRTVRQATYYLGSEITNRDRLTALRDECVAKRKSPAAPIGFAR